MDWSRFLILMFEFSLRSAGFALRLAEGFFPFLFRWALINSPESHRTESSSARKPIFFFNLANFQDFFKELIVRYRQRSSSDCEDPSLHRSAPIPGTSWDSLTQFGLFQDSLRLSVILAVLDRGLLDAIWRILPAGSSASKCTSVHPSAQSVDWDFLKQDLTQFRIFKGSQRSLLS